VQNAPLIADARVLAPLPFCANAPDAKELASNITIERSATAFRAPLHREETRITIASIAIITTQP
jgi:hypothetical protein